MTRSVLHVAQPADAGVPRVAATLVADQIARGWGVSVASPPGGDLERAAADSGAAWHAWPATRRPGPETLVESRRLARIVRNAGPDLVHLHSAKAGLAGRLVVRGRVPTVFQPHAWSFEAATGPVRRAAVRWERRGARWADAIVCVSADERRRGEEAGIAGAYEEIPNGVDLAQLSPASAADRARACERLGVGPEPLAVCVGRLHRQKNQTALAGIWPEVRAQVPGARLVLVGEGPLREEIEELSAEGVELVGASDDVRSWMAAASVVVQPSLWEGMSLSVLEALASARSVVATDVPGMREAVAGGAGAIVELHDRAGLVSAIAERLADPALADREGATGRRRAEERYDVARTAERVAGLYDRLLGTAAPSGAGQPPRAASTPITRGR